MNTVSLLLTLGTAWAAPHAALPPETTLTFESGDPIQGLEPIKDGVITESAIALPDLDNATPGHLQLSQLGDPALPPTPPVPENPGIERPAPPPEPFLADPAPAPTPALVLDSLEIPFQDTRNSNEEQNRTFEPVLRFRLPDDNRLSITSGFNQYRQPNQDTVTQIPLRLGWEGQVNDVQVQASAGIDLFNRLPTALNADLSATVPISPSASLTSVVSQGPYRFNAETLNNQITALRYGVNLFWQIEPNLSLFSQLRLGNYNDGNVEQQSFSRLEYRLGEFTLAANLFNWRYNQDLEASSGYFSPPDFLVYNGELAWERNLLEALRCRLGGTLGQQRLRGEVQAAFGVQARCTAQLSPNLEADLGYRYDNVLERSGDSDFNSRAITGGLRMTF